MKWSLIKLATVLSLVLLMSEGLAHDGPRGKPAVSTSAEISAEFGSVPCKNEERLDAVKALFEKMGADPAEISVETFKKVQNLVVRKPGADPASADKIVIGAHYDKTEKGCGAIDNWTGIVALAHLYRTLKDYSPNKTILFVAFGQEERGLVGSTAMAQTIRKEARAEYCAMVNIDSLGMGVTQVADNMSSRKLIDLAETLAKEMNAPFAHARLAGGDSDSSSFVRKKIPALTIHALTNRWGEVLHTDKDQPDKIDQESVYSGYRLALGVILRIDNSSCQAFR